MQMHPNPAMTLHFPSKHPWRSVGEPGRGEGNRELTQRGRAATKTKAGWELVQPRMDANPREWIGPQAHRPNSGGAFIGVYSRELAVNIPRTLPTPPWP